MKNFILCFLYFTLLISMTNATVENQEQSIDLLEFSEDLETLAQLHGEEPIEIKSTIYIFPEDSVQEAKTENQ